jgi:uncharacterized protein
VGKDAPDAGSRGATFLRPLRRAIANGEVPAGTLRNTRAGQILAVTLIPAFDRTTRNKGLLGRRSLEKGSAMILAPCSSVHTVFMKFAIDIIFVARDGRVVKICERCRPWRLALGLGAFAVVELPAGAVEPSGTRVGDRLEIS